MKQGNTLLTVLFIIICCVHCTDKANESTRQQAIMEITNTEKEFAALCKKEGIQKAFAAYCADDANILSGDHLIKGKDSIQQYYSQPFFAAAKLNWSPDFADASLSGDLGYTYGHYVFTTTDSTGTITDSKGIFHSVWKKENGKWKFVWDN